MKARSKRRGRRTAGVLLLAAALVPGGLPVSATEPVPAVQLPTDTLMVMDTIPVTGSRVSADLPLRSRGVTVLDRATLARLPVSDIAGALGWAMGVELAPRSPAQADVSIRGAGFEQVLVLVDGVRMSDPQTGHFDLDLAVPLEGVERIEILRGPASASYGGDAVGGVINVVTRRDRSWELNVEGGSFGTFRGGLRGSLPLPAGARLRLAAEGARSDGHREGTDWEHRLVQAGVDAPFLGGRTSLDLGHADREFGADGFYAPFPSFESTVARTASVGWHPAAGAGIRIEPRLAWRSHDDDFILVREDPSIYRNQHTSTQLMGELTVRGELPDLAADSPPVGWAIGGEYERSRLSSNSLGERSEDRRSGFAEVALAAADYGATFGVRHDDHEAFGGATSPSVSAFWQVSPGIRLRTSWGRSFRGPSWTERYYVDPTHTARDELHPERSSSAEVGIDLAHSSVEVGATAFRRVSRNLIDWAREAGADPAETVWETRNVNRATFRGLELESRWTPRASGDLQLSAGVSLLSVEADAVTGLESKFALRPLTEKLTVGVARELAGGVRGSVMVLHGKRPGDRSFRTMDLRLDRRVLDGVLHLELRNLADSDHPDITGNAVAGRSVVLGYGLTLR